jgi:hypothetical protein
MGWRDKLVDVGGDLVPPKYWPVGAEPARCVGCGELINPTLGTAKDSQARHWHPECRARARRDA